MRMSRSILRIIRKICDEIEKQVRIQYHLLPEEENAAKEADKAAASAERLRKNKHYHGQTIIQEQQQARRKALRLLEHMDRRSGDLQTVSASCFSEEAAEDAVSYVREFGYINDERYAFNYIMYRIHDKSRQKIFRNFSRRGGQQTIQSAWEEAEELEAPDEHALLLSQIEKK